MSQGPRRSSRARRVAAVLAGTLAALALAEIGARVWLARASPEDFHRYASIADLRERGEQTVFERHAYLGYVPRAGYVEGPNRHDSRGFRGLDVAVPKPAGEYRIACIGGSTTYTQDVRDWRESYPAQMEEELHRLGRVEARVVNAGVPNWTSYEHLVNYEFRLAELDCDLLVVLEGANDLKARLVWPPEADRGDNSGYRTFSTNLTMPPLREHSALWRIVAVRAGWMRPHAELERALDNHSGKSLWGALRSQMKLGTYPADEFAEVGADAMLARNSCRWFERNLTDLAVLAVHDGTRVLFLSTPSCTARISKSEAAARVLEDGLDEMSRAAERVARATGTDWYDVAAAMPRDPALYVDEMHHDAAGARTLGRLVAAHVAARFFDEGSDVKAAK